MTFYPKYWKTTTQIFCVYLRRENIPLSILNLIAAFCYVQLPALQTYFLAK